MTSPKELVYDLEIAPMLRRIIMVCQKHDIAMLATFDIGEQADTQHALALIPNKAGNPRCHLKAHDAIFPPIPPVRVHPRPGNDHEAITIL